MDGIRAASTGDSASTSAPAIKYAAGKVTGMVGIPYTTSSKELFNS